MRVAKKNISCLDCLAVISQTEWKSSTQISMELSAKYKKTLPPYELFRHLDYLFDEGFIDRREVQEIIFHYSVNKVDVVEFRKIGRGSDADFEEDPGPIPRNFAFA